jgi:hypothetical protein
LTFKKKVILFKMWFKFQSISSLFMHSTHCEVTGVIVQSDKFNMGLGFTVFSNGSMIHKRRRQWMGFKMRFESIIHACDTLACVLSGFCILMYHL